jgi:hypothetical protein
MRRTRQVRFWGNVQCPLRLFRGPARTKYPAPAVARWRFSPARPLGWPAAADETELQIIENVADSLWRIRNNFAEAVRNAAYDLMLSKIADVSKAAKAIKPFTYGDALALDAAKTLL